MLTTLNRLPTEARNNWGGENVFGLFTGPSSTRRKAWTASSATPARRQFLVKCNKLGYANEPLQCMQKIWHSSGGYYSEIGWLQKRACLHTWTPVAVSISPAIATSQKTTKANQEKAFPSPKVTENSHQGNREETKQQMKNNTHGHVWWRCKIEWHCLLADPM